MKAWRLQLLLNVGLALSLYLLLLPIFRPARAGHMDPCSANLRNIGMATEMYAANHGGKFPRNLGQLSARFLRALALCPKAGRVTYRISLGPNVPGNIERRPNFYLVECMGGNHEDREAGGDFPSYDPIRGLVQRRGS